MITLNVKSASGLRAVLERGLGLGAGRTRQLLKDGNVKVNGARVRQAVEVAAGDVVTVFLPARYLPEVPIVHADEAIVVAEKRPGLAVLSDEGLDLTMLVQGKYPTARPCHRLDVWTGGLVIFALSDEAEAAMNELIYHHRIGKVYHCIASGTFPKDGMHRAYLIKDAKRAEVRVVDKPTPHAVSIETETRLLRRAGALGRLEVTLHTGRTHQIRAHLAHLGCPLLGDDKYGRREINKREDVRRPCLWAVSLTFPEQLPAPLTALQGLRLLSEPQFPEKLSHL